MLEGGTPLRHYFTANPPSKDDLPLLNDIRFLTAKPVMYIVNMGEQFDDRTRQKVDIIRSCTASIKAEVLPICAEIEMELGELEPEERRLFIRELGIEVHGLREIVQAAYRLLNYITFYTIVSNETRAWSVAQGTTAPEAAGKIHSDMETGFIRADVVHGDVLYIHFKV